jgi:hypothetical protein
MGNAASGRDRFEASFLDYYLVVLLVCAPLCSFLAWQSLQAPPAPPRMFSQGIDLQLLLRNFDHSTLIGYDHEPIGQLAPALDSLSGLPLSIGTTAQQSSALQLELDVRPSRSLRIHF